MTDLETIETFHTTINAAESSNAPFWKFGMAIGAALLFGILGGAILNTVFEKLQGRDVDAEVTSKPRGSCILFFFLQLLANVVLFFLLNRYIKKFVPWLQMTLSGFLFNVLFFLSQYSLQANALCSINF